MVKVKVNPGACGLITNLSIEAEDVKRVNIEIESQCPQIMAMKEDLPKLDGYKECFAKYGDSTVYRSAQKHCRHLACAVPTAIIKGMEVACGLAVPKDVSIQIERE
jgi:hypothetical protein